jgi:ParB-like chromosome segregation protein Spo0J
MTVELSFPIFRDGSVLSAECELNDNSRDSDTAGKSTSTDSEVKINPAGDSDFSVFTRLENCDMSTKNDVLTEVDVDNAIEETRDLSAKMSCTRYVDFGDLYRADNVRGRLVTQIPQMVASLRKNGFKPNHPLVVSKKADGRFLVLVGNRRLEGLEFVRDNHSDEFGRILPSGRVPCIVHEGLTVEEEILVRVDHGNHEDRVALDDWSQFLAIKQLMQAWPGESEVRIAEKLGIIHVKGKNKGKPNRSHVQPRINLARLPIFVQEAFRLLWEEGKDATPVRVVNIKKLYAVYNEEFGKHEDAEPFNGEYGIGPKFRSTWAEITNPAPESDPEDSVDNDSPADLKASAAKTRAMGCNSRLAKRILLAVTNQGGALPELDALAAEFETDSQILTDIRNYLGGDEYADLVNCARDARLAAELAQQEQLEEPVEV